MDTKKTGNRKKFQKGYLTIPFLILLLTFSILLLLNKETILIKNPNTITIEHINSNQVINAEIADNESERYRGLMDRTDLEENQGMLFIFEDNQYRTFWMMNTPQSLDIIFLDESFQVVNFYTNTLPNQTIERYSSQKPVKYVLEIKTGFINRNKVTKGDSFKLIKD